MSKPLIGILYLLGLIGLVAGIFLLISSAAGGTHTVNALGGITNRPGNIPLFIVGLILAIFAGLFLAASWAAALIRLFLLQRWSWFAGVALLFVLAIPVYVVAGPETPALRVEESSRVQ